MSAIQKALCSINEMLMEFHSKWAKELQGVDSSLKSVGITGDIPQQIVGRNPKRVEVLIHNSSTKKLFIAPFQGDIDRNLFSLSIDPDDTLFLNSHNFAHLYKGDIYGFWEENAPIESTVKVTEFYITTQ